MKQLTFILLCFLGSPLLGQNLDFFSTPHSALFDQSYGAYERNKFDIILPKASQQHGLVIFIHGGGFKKGDKKAIYRRPHDIQHFIDNNIAVASVNYRFYNNDDSLGVKLCLQDIQRAIQYLRHHADRYNIDKERVGCYGSSAGAGSSLYFAFQDELAIPDDTTLSGESTRLRCAGAIATQGTYNVFRWKRIIPFMRTITLLKRKEIYHSAANFYGYPNYKAFRPQRKAVARSLDMLEMIDPNDPPIYLMNLQKERFPKNTNAIQHHRKHAIKVAKTLKRNGVENHLYVRPNVELEKDIAYRICDFMSEHLAE